MYFRERLASETNICSLTCFEASVASHSCIQFAQDVMWLKALDQARLDWLCQTPVSRVETLSKYFDIQSGFLSISVQRTFLHW